MGSGRQPRVSRDPVALPGHLSFPPRQPPLGFAEPLLWSIPKSCAGASAPSTGAQLMPWGQGIGVSHSNAGGRAGAPVHALSPRVVQHRVAPSRIGAGCSCTHSPRGPWLEAPAWGSTPKSCTKHQKSGKHTHRESWKQEWEMGWEAMLDPLEAEWEPIQGSTAHPTQGRTSPGTWDPCKGLLKEEMALFIPTD